MFFEVETGCFNIVYMNFRCDKNCRGIYTMDVTSFVVSLTEDCFVQHVVCTGWPETSATNYHSALRKNPRRAHVS